MDRLERLLGCMVMINLYKVYCGIYRNFVEFVFFWFYNIMKLYECKIMDMFFIGVLFYWEFDLKF